jgi:hypothetical protein
MHRCLQAPIHLSDTAYRVEAALSIGEIHAPLGGRTVQVGGEALVFPYRVYYTPDRIDSVTRSMDGDAKVLALCLASRHHDGHVREAAVRNPCFVPNSWSSAFAIQLLGEYVVEIGIAVEDQICKFGANPFLNFALENPGFMETTRRRATSYWHHYHRGACKNLNEYPCYRALRFIHASSCNA